MTTAGMQQRRLLWLTGDVVLVYALNALGVALLLGSTLATTVAEDLSLQVAWVNLGVLGIVIAGTANVFWLLAGRRAVGERRVRLLAVPDPQPVGAFDGVVPNRHGSSTRLVALRGASYFHRPGCPLIAGKLAASASRTRQEAAGRQPCGVCEP